MILLAKARPWRSVVIARLSAGRAALVRSHRGRCSISRDPNAKSLRIGHLTYQTSARLRAAFDQATGREAWRFWTLPRDKKAGEASKRQLRSNAERQIGELSAEPRSGPGR